MILTFDLKYIYNILALLILLVISFINFIITIIIIERILFQLSKFDHSTCRYLLFRKKIPSNPGYQNV